MNIIELSEVTINKLQAMKRPSDTSDSVINRLIDFHTKNAVSHEPSTDEKPAEEDDSHANSKTPQELRMDEKSTEDDSPAIDLSTLTLSEEDFEDFKKELDADLELIKKFHANNRKEPIIFSYDALPNVEFTKCRSIEIEDEKIKRANWNSAIRTILTKIHSSGKQIPNYFHGLQIADGEKTDHGFVYVEDIEKSVQGVASNDAARALFAIAEEYGFSVTVKFHWRKSKRVRNPGQKGIISINT